VQQSQRKRREQNVQRICRILWFGVVLSSVYVALMFVRMKKKGGDGWEWQRDGNRGETKAW